MFSHIMNTLFNPYISANFPFITVFLSVFFLYSVSDLQEEGKNAINAPMNPSTVDIHPEDTLLGKVFMLQTSTKRLLMKVAPVTPICIALLLNVDCSVETERIRHEN